MNHISQCDCCFNELLNLWYENDFCDMKYITEIKSKNFIDNTTIPEARIWVNDIYDILLYTNTLLDKYHEKYNFALFGNEVKQGPKESSWIFWQRWPRKYYKFVEENRTLTYDERNIRSIYIGNFTNSYRSGNWKDYIEFFSMGNMNNHFEKDMIYPYNEYLRNLSQSKYGLCLRGVGPKSLRENECLGLGTVPIFTPGVSVEYYNKLEKDKHFLYVNTPEEIPELLNSITKKQWEYMSDECIKWWNNNSSLNGSFKTTIEILEKNNVI